MGLSPETGMPVLMVFSQGLPNFSFPCVLPPIPLYVSYPMGGARDVDSNGNICYPRGRILVGTLFLVVGISLISPLLGFGLTALGGFSRSSQTWFARISGTIMILSGLYQLGVFGRSGVLEREHRLPFRLDRWAMNPLVALVLGFIFSFAWTPCVGPTLGSVLLAASSAGSAARGFSLIAVYTLGFVIPFLVVGLFTGAVLGPSKRYQRVVCYTVKVGTVLLVLIGVMTLIGFMNGITSYLPSAAGSGAAETPRAQTSGTPVPTPEGSAPAGPEESPAASGRPMIPAPDFTLVNQYGEEYTLFDYEGKAVFFNSWATWRGPCKCEMPEVQVPYERYGNNGGDVIVLGVANPKSEEYPYRQNVTQPEVEQFLEDGGYTFPVVMDIIGEVLYSYSISAFPTTFIIGADGNVFGYVPGALTGDMMEPTVQQIIDGVEVGA